MERLWKHGPARCVCVRARVVGRCLLRALETPCCGVLQASCCHPPALSMPLCGAAKCLRDALKWSEWFTFPTPGFFILLRKHEAPRWIPQAVQRKEAAATLLGPLSWSGSWVYTQHLG